MTLVAFQDGKVVLRDGKVGTEQACCCPTSTCECPSCEYLESLCISATYTIWGCAGSFSNDDFSCNGTGLDGAELASWASEFCIDENGNYISILVEIRCLNGTFSMSGVANFLGMPPGCFATSAEGYAQLACLSAPDYAGLLGAHGFDVKLVDVGGPCENQVIGSVTFTIAEPPC